LLLRESRAKFPLRTDDKARDDADAFAMSNATHSISVEGLTKRYEHGVVVAGGP
jgi:hypothetical protein